MFLLAFFNDQENIWHLSLGDEDYDLRKDPPKDSKVAVLAMQQINSTVDLSKLGNSLLLTGTYIFFWICTLSGHTELTELQIKLKNTLRNVSDISDDTLFTLNEINRAAKAALENMQSTYEYYSGGLTDVALEMSNSVKKIAQDMCNQAKNVEKRCNEQRRRLQELSEEVQRIAFEAKQSTEIQQKEQKPLSQIINMTVKPDEKFKATEKEIKVEEIIMVADSDVCRCMALPQEIENTKTLLTSLSVKNTVDALEKIEFTLKNLSNFWREVCANCDDVSKNKLNIALEVIKNKTDNYNQLKILQSDAFKKNVVEYYGKLVALGESCSSASFKLQWSRDIVSKIVRNYPNEARAKRIPITGTLLKAKAMEFAWFLKIEGFKASNGWLSNWKGRYNVKQYKRCGEGADIDEKVIDDSRGQIPGIISGNNETEVLVVMKLDCYIMPCQTKL